MLSIKSFDCGVIHMDIISSDMGADNIPVVIHTAKAVKSHPEVGLSHSDFVLLALLLGNDLDNQVGQSRSTMKVGLKHVHRWASRDVACAQHMDWQGLAWVLV